MAEDEENIEEDLDLDLGEETAPLIEPKKGGRPPAKSPNNQAVPTPYAEAKMKKMAEARAAEARAAAAQAAAQPQVYAVPRAVPMETMVNEIYDGIQRLEQLLMALLQQQEEELAEPERPQPKK